MATPEGKVKRFVDFVLRHHDAYQHKPVQNGMGKPAIDYHVCHQGFYAAIETKRPGQTFTRRQARSAREVLLAGGAVFLVDDTDGPGLQELIGWLKNPRANFLGLHTAQHLAAHFKDNNWKEGHERTTSDDDERPDAVDLEASSSDD